MCIIERSLLPQGLFCGHRSATFEADPQPYAAIAQEGLAVAVDEPLRSNLNIIAEERAFLNWTSLAILGLMLVSIRTGRGHILARKTRETVKTEAGLPRAAVAAGLYHVGARPFAA
uniref:DUF202 domain-containing protein n=1 Tax=Parascaris univalens TaxID=6257 RepID=A0A915CF31_PARUN